MCVCGMHAEVTGQLGRVCSLPLQSGFQGLKLSSFTGLMTASLQCVRFVRVITKTPTCRQDFAGMLNSLTRQGLFPLLFF